MVTSGIYSTSASSTTLGYSSIIYSISTSSTTSGSYLISSIISGLVTSIYGSSTIG